MSLLSPDLVEFLDGPNSVMMATQNGSLKPTSTRALTLTCVPGQDRVKVWLPSSVTERAIEDLRVDKRIAVGCSRASSHQTFQLKGHVVNVRSLPEDIKPEVARRFAIFAQECEQVGLPRRLLERVVIWPTVEIEVAVEEIYDQRPGPGAGERCAGGPCP